MRGTEFIHRRKGGPDSPGQVHVAELPLLAFVQTSFSEKEAWHGLNEYQGLHTAADVARDVCAQVKSIINASFPAYLRSPLRKYSSLQLHDDGGEIKALASAGSVRHPGLARSDPTAGMSGGRLDK